MRPKKVFAMRPVSCSPATLMGEIIMQAREMIRSHPDVKGNMSEALVRCIEECYACAQACTACADACLAEAMVDQLRQCIRLDLDCADVCAATGAPWPPGGRARIRRSCASCSRFAPLPAAPAARSARATPASTSIAACAPRPAAVVSRPATMQWPTLAKVATS